ncbi:hypothetical protein LK994_03900 [Ferruginibacter lapsinanis]|uniref:hypothetical protein n=1 Tax=Ferruginibacter lapsinanis TaxID=563172 RepID=UPI001E4B843A|nr:hypothetical protein [Ferruginibacter lapsinanis]UEG50613.1 hypothetical protein LK994_03900 [Ferruginibacter lapsinanis]
MTKFTCLFFSFLLISVCAFSAAPTLSANAIQPVYPGTTKPYLNIISGSGKTSYVSGVLNDPTDPASVFGIYFTITGTFTSVSLTSSNVLVVPNANITFTESGGIYILKINPAMVGLDTISIVATNAGQNSSTYKISYAVSAASSFPDKTIWPTMMADASGAASIDNDYMFVCDDETNVLRLYSRKYSGIDLYNMDITSAVGASAECDLEGASTSVKYNTGKRIYWIGSLGNNKSGKLKPDRDRVIATDVSGTGATSTLSVRTYSAKFRSALISWGDTCSWNFSASSADGIEPKRIDGFNIEGLTVTHGGDTGYIGFRAPCVPIKGTIPNSSNRKYAIVAPVANFETLMNGTVVPVTTTPIIKAPILFDLNGLGIRSIEKVGTNLYLIVAGLYTGGGTPALYLWDGKIPANPGINPITINSTFSKLTKLDLPGYTNLVQVSVDGVAEGHPEALVAEQVGEILYIHVICDNGTIDYYGNNTEAKSLANNQHKKFRYDNFVYDMTNYVANCTNANIPFITNTTYVAGDTYQWQVNSGSGYTDVTDNALYSGATNDTLQLANAPTSIYGYTYRCKITNGASVTYSNEFTLQFKAYWKGTVSNAWETPANWGCNIVPDINTDVYINQGTPVLSSNRSIRSLTVRPTASVKVNSGYTLTIVH